MLQLCTAADIQGSQVLLRPTFCLVCAGWMQGLFAPYLARAKTPWAYPTISIFQNSSNFLFLS